MECFYIKTSLKKTKPDKDHRQSKMSFIDKNRVILKLIILGDSGVGKTALLNRYVANKFSEQYKATIGADFMTHEIEIDGKTVLLQLWDTAGQERFHSLGNAFYRGCDGCIFVYDITNEESFLNIDQWRDIFVEQGSIQLGFPMLLIGNKCDLVNKRRISLEQGVNYANANTMAFYETSALSGLNVKEAIDSLADKASDMENVTYFSQEISDKIDLADNRLTNDNNNQV